MSHSQRLSTQSSLVDDRVVGCHVFFRVPNLLLNRPNHGLPPAQRRCTIRCTVRCQTNTFIPRLLGFVYAPLQPIQKFLSDGKLRIHRPDELAIMLLWSMLPQLPHPDSGSLSKHVLLLLKVAFYLFYFVLPLIHVHVAIMLMVSLEMPPKVKLFEYRQWLLTNDTWVLYPLSLHLLQPSQQGFNSSLALRW